MSNILSTEHLCLECRACEQICPKCAISMRENAEGFSYPNIDMDKCIDCGLCVKVCRTPCNSEQPSFRAAQLRFCCLPFDEVRQCSAL